MKYTSVEFVEPGNVLARTIFTNDGRALLNKGTQLTVGMISTLRRVGVTALYIDEALLRDVVLEEAVSEQTRREALHSLAEAVQYVQSGRDFSSKLITQTTTSIVNELFKNKNVLVNLADIRTTENAQFIHALNVCILSTVMGVNLQLSQAQLYDLALGALLHDIGKLKIPSSDLKEEDLQLPREMKRTSTGAEVLPEGGIVLPENPELWKHTWRGFKRLRKINEFSVPMAHIALSHHEHIDGSGYPRGLLGTDIHKYAKIVSIANFYDHLISGAYGTLYRPYEACELLMGYAGKWFEREYVIQFLRSIAVYPLGSSLKLTTGQIGVVTDLHKGLPTRPIVRIIKQKRQSETEPSYLELDLAANPTIFISEVLS